MNARSVIIVSLGLNVLLAAWVATKLRCTPESSAHALASVMQAGHSGGDAANFLSSPTNAPEYTTNRVDAAGFHWGQIETNDFEAYVANLRGIGCPEATVRALILSEVEQYFSRRAEEVEQPGPFWENEPARRFRRQQAQRRRGSDELAERELIRRLVGVNWTARACRVWADDGDACQGLGILSDESALRLIDAGILAEKRGRAVQDELDGIVIDTDEPRVEALVAELKRGMESSVSPGEAQELLLRLSAMLNMLTERDRLFGVTLTGDELRRLTAITTRNFDLVTLFLRSLMDRSMDHDEILKLFKQGDPSAQAEIKALLGEQRYAAYQRSQDEAFQEFARSAKRHDLPLDTTVKAYEIRRAAEAAARELKANDELSADQRRAALEAMRQETQHALTATVGEKAAKEFFRENQGWAKSAFGAKETKR